MLLSRRLAQRSFAATSPKRFAWTWYKITQSDRTYESLYKVGNRSSEIDSVERECRLIKLETKFDELVKWRQKIEKELEELKQWKQESEKRGIGSAKDMK